MVISASGMLVVTVAVATFATSSAIARSTSVRRAGGTSDAAARYDVNDRSAPATSPSCRCTSAML
jgi:hypothetical protein